MSSTANVSENTEPQTQFERFDRELRALKLSLADSCGFRLMLATYSNKNFRNGLIQRLIADLEKQDTSVGVLDLSRRTAGDDASLPLVLLKAVREVYRHTSVKTDGQIAILVINLEDHIQETRKGGQEVLETANLHRDLFPEACPAPTVLWLAPWATTALARSAPDLWHWRAATFDFTTPVQLPVIDGSWRQEPNFADFAFIDEEGIQKLARELAELTQGSVATTPRGQAHVARLRLQLGDALFVRGQWDRALTLFQEAEKAFAELGDVRSKAVTMSHIADILYRRGDLDQALRICRAEELPVYERLGDVRSKAAVLWKLFQIARAREDAQEAEALIVQSYRIFADLGDAEGIAMAGPDFGRLLIAAGEQQAGLAVLRQSEMAARKLGRSTDADQVAARIAEIEKGVAAGI